MSVTTHLNDFGLREIEMTEKLLKAWREQGLPDDFYADQVKPMMNQDSGNVFLTNSNYEVAMMNGDDLESFYSCPNCGHEGFMEEIDHGEDDAECQEWLQSIKN